MKIYRLKITRLKIPEYFQAHRKSRCDIKITNIKTPNTIVLLMHYYFVLLLIQSVYTCKPLM